MDQNQKNRIYRRSFLKKTFASLALGVTGTMALKANPLFESDEDPGYREYAGGKIRITKLETFKVKPRFLFL